MQASGTTVHALNRNASFAMQFVQSHTITTGACENATEHILVASLSDAPTVTPPATLPFTLPIHPEILP